MFKDKPNPIIGQKPYSSLSSEIVCLIKQIHHSVTDNKSLLNQIKKIDPKFTYNLYQPINYEGIDQMFIKPLILRQLDQLMNQKQVLIKKREILIFTLNQSRKSVQEQKLTTQNHFTFLRTVWSKIPSTKLINSSQKIDNLNKVIGMVKLNIKNLTEKEEIMINKDIQTECSKSLFIQARYKAKIRQQNQRLKMRNQELQMKYFGLQQQLKQKNQKINALQKQLTQTQNKLNKALSNLSDINVKLLTFQREMDTYELSSKRNHDIQDSQKYLQFNGFSQDFKIKILSTTMVQINLEETHRNLIQILQFLRSKPVYKYHALNKSSSFEHEQTLPSLNLNETASTSENSLSQRYFNKKERFIPIKTERSNMRVKTVVVNCESALQQCEQLRKQEVVDNLMKRFNRKADFPLTSDRFRKINQKKSLAP